MCPLLYPKRRLESALKEFEFADKYKSSESFGKP